MKTESMKDLLDFIATHTTGFEVKFGVGTVWNYEHEDGHFEKVSEDELLALFKASFEHNY